MYCVIGKLLALVDLKERQVSPISASTAPNLACLTSVLLARCSCRRRPIIYSEATKEYSIHSKLGFLSAF